MIARAMYLANRSSSPDGHLFGIVPIQGKLLRDASYRDIQTAAHLIDYSAGTEAHEPFYQNIIAGHKLIEPLLISTGVTTPEEIHQLYEKLPAEMLSDDFCGLLFFQRTWGQKPED